VLIGCEGASEASYAAFLQEIVRAGNIPVALKIEQLSPGAGDALSRMTLLMKKISEHRRRGTTFGKEDRFALLDFVQAANGQNRTQQADALAAQHSVSIVWQRPSFEALLLRHCDGQLDRQFASPELAFSELKRLWPDYEKPMPRLKLAKRVDLAKVIRLSAREPSLAKMLRRLGLIP
jgi:hypothetical protein